MTHHAPYPSHAASSWRSLILREFMPKVARLTLVADPDGLLLEEGILDGIRSQGFELIPFEDHIDFRYRYESTFRSRWDRGEETDLVVVLRSPSNDLNALPYDLLQAGRKLSFNLGDLFPKLSYPVVAALDRSSFDTLFEAQAKYAPEQLGDKATKQFVLRHVFEIVPELIKQPSDLLHVLLRRHYRRHRIPAILDEHLLQELRQNSLFADWPLETIIPDAQAFFAFLQERWPVFLDHFAAEQCGEQVHVRERAPSYELPALHLPFDHPDVRIYIDNLFLEGMLQPVAHRQARVLANTWVIYGIKNSPAEDRLRRIKGLLDSCQTSLPGEQSSYREWIHFAQQWAQLNVLIAEHGLPNNIDTQIQQCTHEVDTRFRAWVTLHYASLSSLPATDPVILHHLPRYFAHSLQPKTKLAFLLVDGLALDQWIVLREVLREQEPTFLFRERAVFAWIPTITSVSRQAAFAGKLPFFFSESIHTTRKEPELWTTFWEDQKLSQAEVAYLKGLGNGHGDVQKIDEIIAQPKLRVVGLVIDTVDKILHGMQLGSAGMHNQIREWARQGFMRDLIARLHDAGFHIYLASDHGNIEASGVGRPSEGVLAEVRGERVRVYANAQIRQHIAATFPGSLAWDTAGLPTDYFALIAPNRAAFVPKDDIIVCHGGISIEELIVPFVQIERRNE
ncbi:BREX-3 system phosphatase PglZ [Chloroflexus sp.]|uniref:BREX-3 system phosphatase PglZ n=1 Tax=Chloroflexus sp. TaxID=1904827 RepID=UPI002ACDB043|nr:BREX-3 system phosphatase PglZ [Chloroflexus sp.]